MKIAKTINETIVAIQYQTRIKYRYNGNKQYELSNHLGNVLVTISDRRKAICNEVDSTLSYRAIVVTATDYYSFGSPMVGRTYEGDTSLRYRYGFNGKELDKEGMGGGQSTYDYGFRIYNPALGRFLSVDPLTSSYPWYTPYQFAGNSPICAIDLDGLEEWIVIYWYKDGKANGSTIIALNDPNDRADKDAKGGFYINVNESSKKSPEEMKTTPSNWKDLVFDKKNDEYTLKDKTKIVSNLNNGIEKVFYGQIDPFFETAYNEVGLKSQAIKFQQGSDELFEIADNTKFIEGIKKLLVENPDYKVKVTGYASEEGDEKANLDLSVKRATALKDYLIKNGIDKDRIIVEGKGETGGTSEESKAASRKVDLTPVLAPEGG